MIEVETELSAHVCQQPPYTLEGYDLKTLTQDTNLAFGGNAICSSPYADEFVCPQG
jgi:hypothetical protein